MAGARGRATIAYKLLKKAAYRLGYDVTGRRLPQYDLKRRRESIPRDMEDEFVELYERTKDFTMTSVARMYSLYQSVRYASERGVEGDFVECGVWRGGSCMLMALTLKALGDCARSIYLYDTFAGMTRPDTVDVRFRDGEEQVTRWEVSQRQGYNEWCFVPLDEVRDNLHATGYPRERLVFVKGEVENTLPESAPARIALLRLDTDWYDFDLSRAQAPVPEVGAERRPHPRRLRLLRGRQEGRRPLSRRAAHRPLPPPHRRHRPHWHQKRVGGRATPSRRCRRRGPVDATAGGCRGWGKIAVFRAPRPVP